MSGGMVKAFSRTTEHSNANDNCVGSLSHSLIFPLNEKNKQTTKTIELKD